MTSTCPVPFTVFVPRFLLSAPVAATLSIALYASIPYIGRVARTLPFDTRRHFAQRLMFANNAFYGLLSLGGAALVFGLLFDDRRKGDAGVEAWCSVPRYREEHLNAWKLSNGLYLASKLWEFLDIVLLVTYQGNEFGIPPHFRIHHATTYFLTLLSYCHSPSAILQFVHASNMLHHGIMYPYFALQGVQGWERLRNFCSRALEVSGTFQLVFGIFAGFASVVSRVHERLEESKGHESKCDVSNGAMAAEGILFGFMLLFLWNWVLELRGRWARSKEE